LLAAKDLKHSPKTPLPQSWMSLDIKLGSLTVNMEEDKWFKGNVNEKKANFMAASYDQGEGTPRHDPPVNNSNPRGNQAASAREEEKKEESKLDELNMGQKALYKIMGACRRRFQTE
jgi:hypothetical protein